MTKFTHPFLRLALATLLMMANAWLPAYAVMPDEMLKNPALEARARALSTELRCVVCQNQSIDDSNAPIARDLRLLLRERLTAGDTDQQAIDYIVARYGNFVLLKPPFQWNTALLWGGPMLFVILGLIGAARYVRNRAAPLPSETASPLSAEEQFRIETLLGEKGST